MNFWLTLTKFNMKNVQKTPAIDKCFFIILLRLYVRFMALYFHWHAMMHVMEMSLLEGTNDAKDVSEFNIFAEHF